MTDTKDEMHDDMAQLEACFAAARDATPVVSADFMARVADQALVEQQARHIPLASPAQLGQPVGRLRQFMQALGGWPALSGLATATCAGVWLGISPPQPVALAAETYLGLETTVTLLDMNHDAAFDLGGEAL